MPVSGVLHHVCIHVSRLAAAEREKSTEQLLEDLRSMPGISVWTSPGDGVEAGSKRLPGPPKRPLVIIGPSPETREQASQDEVFVIHFFDLWFLNHDKVVCFFPLPFFSMLFCMVLSVQKERKKCKH